MHDPSLAPAGHHVVTIDVNSQPYTLADGEWDDIKEKVADRAVERLAGVMPDLPELIVHRQVLSPLDLERLFGMTGGHALHGDMSFDQLYAFRPVRGWARYRTPIRNFYLCGAGTHPGGGVTGANGRNCAREVLRDAGTAERQRGGSREPGRTARDRDGAGGSGPSVARSRRPALLLRTGQRRVPDRRGSQGPLAGRGSRRQRLRRPGELVGVGPVRCRPPGHRRRGQ